MSYFNDLSIDKELTDEVSKEVRTVALKALRNIVLKTPFRDGQAKGNWQVGIDTDPTSEIDRADNASGSIAIGAGSATINSIKGEVPSEVVIANNLPYIERLNDGWSEQAPAKFVEKALRRAIK